MFHCFIFSVQLNFLCFYAAYFCISLIEESMKIATFFFRVDLLNLTIILGKISLEISLELYNQFNRSLF